MPSSPSSTTTTTEPWEEIRPQLLRVADLAQQQFDANPTGSERYANQNDLTTRSQNQILNRVDNGTYNPAAQAAQGAVTGVLNSTPYDDNGALYRNIESRVLPTVNGAFGGAGRTGSGLHQDAVARGLTEAYSPVAQQNYQNATENKIRAASIAPQADDAALGGIYAQDAIGRDRRAEDQLYRDAGRAQLSEYANYITALGGQGGSITSPNQSGGFGGALGGGLSGASVGSAFGPFGTAIGGGLGLLGGLFG